MSIDSAAWVAIVSWSLQVMAGVAPVRYPQHAWLAGVIFWLSFAVAVASSAWWVFSNPDTTMAIIRSGYTVAGLLVVVAGLVAWMQRRAVPTTGATVPPTSHRNGDIGSEVTNPYPQSILTSRYYSTKNKEDVSAILDKTADAINKKGNDLFLMAETAINKSPWDRPGEDLAPMIDRLAYIEAVTTDFRRDLFEVLYRDYPDYRIELNNLLFPQVPAANFGGGAKGFHNALVVWSEHRDSLDGTKRQEFVDLVNTARFAFAGFREEFLKWATERQTKIAQTRMALQK
jgi:hypothetical protein